MNRTLKFALGAILGLGLVMPATAQNFPDIPDNHWAYEALANLRGKVLFGYPDGLYRPARPMSRAEFAVAVNQLYQMMMAGSSSMSSSMNALSQKVTALENRPVGTEGPTTAEFNALKRQMADLQNSINGMRGWGADIASLKRLAGEFEKELAGVGVDVDAMKRDMSDLASRVAALEEGGDGIQIHGQGNFVMLAGHSTDGNFGMTKTGRITGFGRDDYDGAHVGMTRDLSMFHEFNVTMTGEAGEGVNWKASFNWGNMLGWYDDRNFGDMGSQNAGENFDDDQDPVMFFDELTVSFDESLAGQGFSADVGRFRHSGGAFFLARPDFTEFYKNDIWDDGKYLMDGARLNFGFGSADLTVLAARNSDRFALGSHPPMINFMMHDIFGDDFQVDATLGLELAVDLGNDAQVRGVNYWQDSWTEDSGSNRMNVFGGEVEFSFNDLDVYGVFSQTDFRHNNSLMIGDDNTAMAVWTAYDAGNWGFNGGYAEVEGNFGAFGSWGRIGTEWNPSNIKGFGGGVWFQASEDLTINANAGFWEGTDAGPGAFGLPLSSDDKVTDFSVMIDYNLNNAWGLTLGYENVDWSFDGDTNPSQMWYTVGLNYSLSDQADVSFLYMLSDVDFKGNGSGLDPFGDDVYKGGMLGTQVSFKF